MRDTKSIFILFLICLVSSAVLAEVCQFKKKVKLTFLSGAMTSLARDMGLLKSEKIKFVSDLFLTDKEKKAMSSVLVRGGLFLSVKTMKEMQNSHVFYDQSKQLRKQFTRVGLNDIEEVVTRGLGPIEAAKHTLNILKPYLTNSCRKLVKQRELKWEQQVQRVVKMSWNRKKVIFFLGRLKGAKLPQIMILNDGFVKTLKKYNKIISYPSSFDYSPWSQKILENFVDDETLLIGVSASQGQVFSVKKHSKNRIDITDFEVLIPGVGQLKFLESLAKWQETREH